LVLRVRAQQQALHAVVRAGGCRAVLGAQARRVRRTAGSAFRRRRSARLHASRARVHVCTHGAHACAERTRARTGSHCTVRLGHSSACVSTRSYSSGALFFHVRCSACAWRSSSCTCGAWARAAHAAHAVRA
jgi:hypothetical protein